MSRVAVRCACCGGPAVATIALVLSDGQALAEEIESSCPHCGPRA